jgi:6-phosphogluconolactonase
MEEWTQRAVVEISARADAAISQRGRFRLALSGGATPRPVYAALAHAPDIDWPRWELFWSDERTVPPTSPDSNFGMAAELLLQPLAARSIVPGRVERMQGELQPADAAAAYADLLHTLEDKPLPRFDLIHLGIGADGHTASLFPHTAALNEAARPVVENPVPKLNTTRLTFTFPLINAARNVLFLLRGEDKALALKTILQGQRDVAQWPTQGVQPAAGSVTWLVDEAAARLLDQPV